jgi:hypothetical protein
MESDITKFNRGFDPQYHNIINNLVSEEILQTVNQPKIGDIFILMKSLEINAETTDKRFNMRKENKPKIKNQESKHNYKVTAGFLCNLINDAGNNYFESYLKFGNKEVNWLYNQFLNGYLEHLKRETTTNKIDDRGLLDRLAAENVSNAISSTYRPYLEQLEDKTELEEFKIKPGEELRYTRNKKQEKPKEIQYINDEDKKNVVMVCSNEKHYNVKSDLEQIANFSIIENPKELSGEIDLLLIYTDNEKYKIDSVFKKMFEDPYNNSGTTRYENFGLKINSVMIFSENEQKAPPIYQTCNVKNGVKGLKKKIMKVLYNK